MDSKYALKDEKDSKERKDDTSQTSGILASKRAPPPTQTKTGRASASAPAKTGAMVSGAKLVTAQSHTGTLSKQAADYIRTMEESVSKQRQQPSSVERKEEKKVKPREESTLSRDTSTQSDKKAPSLVEQAKAEKTKPQTSRASEEADRKGLSLIEQAKAEKTKHQSSDEAEKKNSEKVMPGEAKAEEKAEEKKDEAKASQEELPFDQGLEEIESLKLEGYLSTSESIADITKKWEDCEEVECVVENSTEKTIGGHFLAHIWAIGRKTKTPFEVREGLVDQVSEGWFSPVCSPLLYSASLQEQSDKK